MPHRQNGLRIDRNHDHRSELGLQPLALAPAAPFPATMAFAFGFHHAAIRGIGGAVWCATPCGCWGFA